MKVIFWVITSILLAALMLVAGFHHLINPEFYVPIVPHWFSSPLTVIYLFGIIEILLGTATLFLHHKYTRFGLLGIFILMVLFMPLHLLDALSDAPAIGSSAVAYARLALQLLLIWLSWKSYQFTSLTRFQS